MSVRNVLAAASAILFVLGCGNSHMTDGGGDDAAIVIPDGALNDAGTDSGPPPSATGAACMSDADCSGTAGTCLTEAMTGLAGGYCSAFCTSDSDCASDAMCVQIDRTNSVCLVNCDPTGTNQCRMGYGCANGVGIPPVCLPGCEDATDCPSGDMCQPGGGFSAAGACYSPDAGVGDACSSSDQCPNNSICASQGRFGWPGGSCIMFGCDLNGNTGCTGDSQCLPFFRGGGCFDGCTSASDCRAGYDCRGDVSYPDRVTCQPSFTPSDLGQPCSTSSGVGCVGGACLTEESYGYPGSYCVAEACDPSATDSGCPSGGVCVAASGSTLGYCFQGCGSDSDCRTAYACRPSDSADPTSATACFPGCTDDSQCTATLQDGTALHCNVGTGECLPPLAMTSIGEPCVGDGSDCVGGRCLSESGSGWPAGTCGLPGCRLSGTGPSTDCPSGTVCADDGSGDPALGVCISSCTAGGTACRTGYECRATDPADSSSPTACLPACTSDACATGHTCNTTSGLCE